MEGKQIGARPQCQGWVIRGQTIPEPGTGTLSAFILSGHSRLRLDCPLCAIRVRRPAANGISIRSPRRRGQATRGTVRPNVLAVLRLITNSYLVGACTGKSLVSRLLECDRRSRPRCRYGRRIGPRRSGLRQRRRTLPSRPPAVCVEPLAR